MQSMSVILKVVLIQVNRQACESTGYTEEELLSMKITEVDAVNVRQDMVMAQIEALAKEKALTLESYHKRKDSSVYPVEIKVSMLKSRNGTAILGIARDITERKAAEEELRKAREMLEAAVAQSPSGILIADAPNVNIRIANEAAFCIRGGNKKVLTGIDVQEHADRWQTFRSDGSPYPPEELPLSRAVLKRGNSPGRRNYHS